MKGGQSASGAPGGASRFSDSSFIQQFQVRTPVVSVYNNSYNLSTIGANSNSICLADAANSRFGTPGASSAWTADEHHRFLDGLEQFGGGSMGGNQNQGVGSAQHIWQSIAAAVRTRSLPEVKMHANRYFLELQLANSRKRSEHLLMQAADARWTLEEDSLFEHLLAFHASRGDAACYPWDQIAAKIPNKTPRDVQERYHKLCYDVARIEGGHHVTMSFGRQPFGSSRSTKAGSSGGAVYPVSAFSIAAAGRDQQEQQQQQEVSTNPEDFAQGPCDCVVTLMPEEEMILMKALEQVRVSPDAPPQVLTSVASAMAAIVNSRQKKPPQRAQPLFSLEDAKAVFEELINFQSYQQQERLDPRVVIEALVTKLRLQPREQELSGTKNSVRTGQHLKPLATAGLAFTSNNDDDSGLLLTPKVYQMSAHFADAKSDISQRGVVAEDLLSFRAASSRHSGGSGGDVRSSSSSFSAPAMSSRQLSMFSPTGGSYSHQPLPSPLYSPYPSYTPRGAASNRSAAGGHNGTGGDPEEREDDGAAVAGRERQRTREKEESSAAAFRGVLEDY